MASVCKQKYFKWQNSKMLGYFPVPVYTVLAKKTKPNQNQQRPKCINTVLNFDSMKSH